MNENEDKPLGRIPAAELPDAYGEISIELADLISIPDVLANRKRTYEAYRQTARGRDEADRVANELDRSYAAERSRILLEHAGKEKELGANEATREANIAIMLGELDRARKQAATGRQTAALALTLAENEMREHDGYLKLCIALLAHDRPNESGDVPGESIRRDTE